MKMRKNIKLMKAALMIPCAATVFTGIGMPLPVSGYQGSIAAYAQELPTERTVIRLDDLKTDFDEASGITATLDEYYGIYKIQLNAGGKYLITGSNYINDSYVDMRIEVNAACDVFFDHVYIKNDNGSVFSTSIGSGTVWNYTDRVTPIKVNAKDVTISGTAVLDVYHNSLVRSPGSAFEMEKKVNFENASIFTNGKINDYLATMTDENDSLCLISSCHSDDDGVKPNGGIGSQLCVENAADKKFTGYRLYRNDTMVSEMLFDQPVGDYYLTMRAILPSDCNAIELLTEDGSYMCRRYRMIEENGTEKDIICQENSVAALPKTADHDEYTFVGDHILHKARSHTAGDWTLSETDSTGVRKCIYCDQIVDSCKHWKRKMLEYDTGVNNCLEVAKGTAVDGLKVSMSGKGTVEIYGISGVPKELETEDGYIQIGDQWYYYGWSYVEAWLNGELTDENMTKTLLGTVNNPTNWNITDYADFDNTQFYQYYGMVCDGDDITLSSKQPFARQSLITQGEAVGATCNSGAYTPEICSECGLTVTKTEGEEPSSNHEVVHHERVEADCETDGSLEYWECKTCNKKYSDEECRTEIPDKELVLPANGHSYQYGLYHVDNENTHSKACDVCLKADGETSAPHEFAEKYGELECACGFRLGSIENKDYALEYTYSGNPVPAPAADNFTIHSAAEPVFTWYRTDLTGAEILPDKESADYLGAQAPTDAGTYTLVASVDSVEGRYTAASTKVCVVINKGTPEYTVPSDVTGVCGKPLSEVSLPTGFTWTDDTSVILDAGNDKSGKKLTFKAKYTDADDKNYNAVEDIEIPVQVVHDDSSSAVEENRKQPTCVEDGSYDEVVKCAGCKLELSRTQKTGDKAAGHSYKKPVFEWSEDKTAAAVTLTCENCKEGTEGHTKTEQAEVTSATTREADCKNTGLVTYTATYHMGEDVYTDTAEVTVPRKADKHVGGTVIRSVKAASYTSTGYTGDVYCKGCGAKLVTGKVIPKKQQQQQQKLADGDLVKLKNGVTYKIISVKKLQVAYHAASRKAKGNVQIPVKVKIDGKSFKVVQISADAFKKCAKVTGISVPTTVSIIEDRAFAQAKKLKYIYIKTNNLKAENVSAHAFQGVKKKVLIRVPKKKLGKYTELFRKKGLSKKVEITNKKATTKKTTTKSNAKSTAKK